MQINPNPFGTASRTPILNTSEMAAQETWLVTLITIGGEMLRWSQNWEFISTG